MADIDLIPDEYRALQWLRLWMRRFVIALCCLLTVTILVYGGLSVLVSQLQEQLRNLQKEKAITTLQRDDLTRLTQQKEELSRQWQLLSRLRGGTTAQQMFTAIDRSLTDKELWFQRWDFNRAGTVVNEGPKTVNRGYFIVVPQGEKTPKAQTWQIRTHMNILGEAKDHSALSRFIQGLFTQPQVADVRVLHTASRQYRDVKVVEFELVILVHSLVEST